MSTSTLLTASPAQSAVRLRHLFRATLTRGQIHPLLHLLQRHRGSVAAAQDDGSRATTTAASPAPFAALGADDVRRRVAALPPLPQAVLRALQTLQREDSSLDEVAQALACDASLTACTLRLANSPFYGVPGRVTTVSDAARLLGRRTLESVVTLGSVANQWPARPAGEFDRLAFWRHAMASAFAARGLARAAQLDEASAFVAGLLHDLGLLAMSVYFDDALEALLRRAREEDEPLSTIEGAHGLTPHAEVGSWIAAHWHFPPAVVQAIAGHHRPDASGPSLTDCVHVGSTVAHALDVSGLRHEQVPPMDPGAWQRVGLHDAAMLQLFEETEAGVQALCTVMAL